MLELRHFFEASQIPWIWFIGDGCMGGMGSKGRWGAKDGFIHTFEQKSSHCVFIEVHKQPQFTCQAHNINFMITENSFTPV